MKENTKFLHIYVSLECPTSIDICDVHTVCLYYTYLIRRKGQSPDSFNQGVKERAVPSQRKLPLISWSSQPWNGQHCTQMRARTGIGRPGAWFPRWQRSGDPEQLVVLGIPCLAFQDYCGASSWNLELRKTSRKLNLKINTERIRGERWEAA